MKLKKKKKGVEDDSFIVTLHQIIMNIFSLTFKGKYELKKMFNRHLLHAYGMSEGIQQNTREFPFIMSC